MNKKDYKKIIDKLNKKLNTNIFNFEYCGGTFKTIAGNVDVYLHSYDNKDKVYSIFIEYHNPKQAMEYTPMVDEYDGKANIHCFNSDEAINMIDYYLIPGDDKVC